MPLTRTLGRSCTRTFTPHRFLRPPKTHRLQTTIERHPALDISTFGNLAPWALSHLSPEHSPCTSVLVRHHDTQPYTVQRALLRTTCRATPPEVLDLTAHPTRAGLMFLYWLFHRRLPREAECALPDEGEEEMVGETEERRARARERREHFTWGLIASWVVGSKVAAVGFQNDVLRTVAGRLHWGEMVVSKSNDPHDSRAIVWSREAFDYSSEMEVEQTNLSDFAVDVAAKRVYDVGICGLTLSPKEEEALSTNGKFASAVFGSLGGLIGTKGIGILDFARAYLVEEDRGDGNSS